MDHRSFTTFLLSLPPSFRIFLASFLLIEFLGVGMAGTPSVEVGRYWGYRVGFNPSPGYIPGGIGGVNGGALLFVYIDTVFIASLGEGNIGSPVWLVCSFTFFFIIGGVLGSRSKSFAKISYALTGALSFASFLILAANVSTQLTCCIILLITTTVFLLFLLFLPHNRTDYALNIFTAFTASQLLILAIDLWELIGFVDALTLFVPSAAFESVSGGPKRGSRDIIGVAGSKASWLLAAWVVVSLVLLFVQTGVSWLVRHDLYWSDQIPFLRSPSALYTYLHPTRHLHQPPDSASPQAAFYLPKTLQPLHKKSRSGLRGPREFLDYTNRDDGSFSGMGRW